MAPRCSLAKFTQAGHSLGSVLTHRAVFLDRDDTLMVNVPYLGDPSKVSVFPEAAEALKELTNAGFLLFIVSNQSGVGRGLITPQQVDAVNQELQRQLGSVEITAIYNCFCTPEDPDAALERKPAPGLLFRCQAEHHLDMMDCFFIGDRLSDIQCAINAGCTPILLRHPLASARHNQAEDAEAGRLASLAVENLLEAATWIISLSRADFTDDSIMPPSATDLLS